MTYPTVLDECKEYIANGDAVDITQFRSGIYSIHDFVYMHVMQCVLESDKDLDNKKLEQKYFDIIKNSVYAIQCLRNELPGQEKSDITVQQIETNNAMKAVDGTSKSSLTFGEIVPKVNEHTKNTDEHMAEINKQISKNRRRTV